MTPDARLAALVAETTRTAAKHGYRQHSHQYDSYVRGAFQVAAQQHPELGPMRVQYLQKLGVIL